MPKLINVHEQNGSISFVGDPHKWGYNLTDILQLSHGPREQRDGLRSCLTYNPPGSYEPGLQKERAVSYFYVKVTKNKMDLIFPSFK